jgi:hypothetical protein
MLRVSVAVCWLNIFFVNLPPQLVAIPDSSMSTYTFDCTECFAGFSLDVVYYEFVVLSLNTLCTT